MGGPWKKGVSGNPKGRPRGSVNYRNKIMNSVKEGCSIRKDIADVMNTVLTTDDESLAIKLLQFVREELKK